MTAGGRMPVSSKQMRVARILIDCPGRAPDKIGILEIRFEGSIIREQKSCPAHARERDHVSVVRAAPVSMSKG